MALRARIAECSEVGKYLRALGVLILAMSVVGCGVSVSAYTRPQDPAAVNALDKTDRSDCGAILGTAFRSQGEQSWYAANCSHWPLTKFDTASAVSDGCAAMQGKPYANDDARKWYQQNCSPAGLPGSATANPTGAAPLAPAPPPNPNGAPPPNPNSAPPAPPADTVPAPVQQPAQAYVAQDRYDCSAIRGTAYN